MEDEIKQAAYEGAAAAQKDVVFPAVQAVEVINFPEQTAPVVNVEAPIVNVPAPVVNVPKANITVNPTPVTVNVPDFPEIPPTQIDLDSVNGNLEDIKDILEEIEKKEFGSKNISGGTPNVMAVVDELDKQLDVSTKNSSTTALDDTEVFTGEWEDVRKFGSVTIAVATDVAGYYQIQFSPDGVNADSTLTRYHKANEIHVPHRFTVTRQYFRVVYTNNSGSNQTYFRLQTLLGDRQPLNAPLDGVLAQDFDAIVTRPSDYNTEVALGLRQGNQLWNKFGYNDTIASGTELIASWASAAYSINTTASTLTIVSSSTADDDGGTGTNSIVIHGVDANWEPQVELVTMDGQTNVVTTSTWIGINRVAQYLCGTGQVNAGAITITATTGGRTMAVMPAGGGVTQQCIFYVPANQQFIAEWLWANAVRPASQNPLVTIKFWVYSTVNNGKQEVYRKSLDTAVQQEIDENPNLPFPIGEKSICWLEATTNQNDTIVEGRFSGTLVKDVDA